VSEVAKVLLHGSATALSGDCSFVESGSGRAVISFVGCKLKGERTRSIFLMANAVCRVGVLKSRRRQVDYLFHESDRKEHPNTTTYPPHH
jgi:hypothetical protein